VGFDGVRVFSVWKEKGASFLQLWVSCLNIAIFFIIYETKQSVRETIHEQRSDWTIFENEQEL
jgi:hypothetical protein